MQVVVVGSGVSGLIAARQLMAQGHTVRVLDKGRNPGGRLATRRFTNGSTADHGAQFFTARSEVLNSQIEQWMSAGIVREWCRGFTSNDGHPRYAAIGGMAELAKTMTVGIDVQQSVRVDTIRQTTAGWSVNWVAGHGRAAGSIQGDAVILTTPVPQATVLLGPAVPVPDLTYRPTLCLLVALDRPPAIPAPGGLQFSPDLVRDDRTWSWIGDNAAKGTSVLPAVTFHVRPDVSAARLEDSAQSLHRDLLSAAEPWLDGAVVLESTVHKWRYAIPESTYPERFWSSDDGRLVLAGDGFGSPRVEGAFLSGLAAADFVLSSAA